MVHLEPSTPAGLLRAVVSGDNSVAPASLSTDPTPSKQGSKACPTGVLSPWRRYAPRASANATYPPFNPLVSHWPSSRDLSFSYFTPFSLSLLFCSLLGSEFLRHHSSIMLQSIANLFTLFTVGKVPRGLQQNKMQREKWGVGREHSTHSPDTCVLAKRERDLV